MIDNFREEPKLIDNFREKPKDIPNITFMKTSKLHRAKAGWVGIHVKSYQNNFRVVPANSVAGHRFLFLSKYTKKNGQKYAPNLFWP